MTVELWGISSRPYFQLPVSPAGYLVVLALAAVTLLSLWAGWRSTGRLRRGQWALLLALLILAPLLSQVALIRTSSANLLSPPGVPAIPRGPALAVFGAVAWVLAGGMLGLGPALLVGLAAGLARGAWDTNNLITPFQTALLAGLVAGLMQQDFRGLPAAILRQPAVAALLGAVLFWPMLYVALGAYSPVQGLAGWDYVTALALAAAPLMVAEAAIAGLAGQLLRAALPGAAAWPRRAANRPAPYVRSLNLRILYSLIPLGLMGITVLFWADTSIAINVASRLVVEQMGRSAHNAGRGLPFFFQTGRSLIQELAGDPALQSQEAVRVVAGLQRGLRAVPFFRQLTYFDADQRPVAGFPVNDVTQLNLTPGEMQAILLGLEGVPRDLAVYPLRPGDPVLLAFVAPVAGPGGQVVGALLGRADLASNPLMTPVLDSLRNVIAGEGAGFMVDERGKIVYHPDPGALMGDFAPDLKARALRSETDGARAYQDVAPDGTRRLVYYLPVAGHPWSVVVETPFTVVLGLATQISAPLLVILILIGAIVLLIISFLARRLTRPVEVLAVDVARMTQGDLSQPMRVTGEDEVGRLGIAFEEMRQRLHARLDELSLLLKVSQSVAGSLSLDEALPPILQGALTASGASGVRLVLPTWEDLPGETVGQTLQSFALGQVAPLMAPLDREILTLTRNEGQAVIENLSRARAVLNVSQVAGRLQALIALPLRHEHDFYGALWLGFEKPRNFAETDLNFLTTLAGQAAVACASARLFQSAERGRERLAAILASTSDAVIVTDRSERLLLVNPAAENVFGLIPTATLGRPVVEAIQNPDLLTAIRSVDADPAAREVRLADGVVLYASTSPITGADGRTLGRVSVLRDVTRFKELETLKSEFVATVSHDLRAPLTYMRGYATMLPMMGDMNEKQKEFAEKIVSGIEQMTELIDDLLDIGRIEAGIGLQRERVRVDDLVQTVVSGLRPQAVNKGLTLKVELPESLPVVSGDPTLLRQALSNLVENAIKYTPRGGQVRVRGAVQENGLVLSVQDTGLGIAPADQVRLFEKFYRVKQRETINIKGSGLGLAIVKSIVERHGGRVWAESRLGQGSTFFMSLPVDGQT